MSISKKIKQMLGIRKKLFSQSYELSRKDYFQNYLNPSDAKSLNDFLFTFGNQQILSVPVEIIAVGSSTFPSSYWEDLKKISKENPHLHPSQSYNDIDLVVLPREHTELETLKSSILETLNIMNYECKPHKNTPMGTRYCNGSIGERKGMIPFADFGYGIHSITTQLSNQTSLDLILGRPEDCLTAAQKIASEREQNNAFSVVYSDRFILK